MKIAYYTTLLASVVKNTDVSDSPVDSITNLNTDSDNNKVLLFSIWLYYLLKSGSFDSENDAIYVVCDEKMNKLLNSSNIYKFITKLYSGVKHIAIDIITTENQIGYMKYFPPVIEIISKEKFDYIFYSDTNNIIRGNIRNKFTNSEKIPTGYLMFERNITDDNYFSYVKTTEWYSKNKELVDKLPAINGSLFCIKNGVNENIFLKSIFSHSTNDYSSDSVLNYTLYSQSQYLSDQCYIELNAELFFNSVEINRLDSAREIILLRNIDLVLINETLMMMLLCKLENL
jgi:hypothetical protein